ncbi:HtaA domain-containing protein [Arcanobacterium hippocoleae]
MLTAFGFVVANANTAAADSPVPDTNSGTNVDVASLPVKGGQLNWSLRRSFTKYAGGSRGFIDGATESAPDKGYRFPLTSVKTEAGRTVASYRGGTKFRAHCSGDSEESCILKTDMWNLSVVINAGNGLADQNCKHQKFDKDTQKWSTIDEPNCAYIQGEFISGMGAPPYTPFASQNRPETSLVNNWAPEGKLVSKGAEPLVRLDLSGIKPEKAADGTVVYRDVPTYLLEGGNAMMGWQYGYDQPMEKVTFSYNPGGVVEKEADLSAKDKKFASAESYSGKAPLAMTKILPRRIGQIGSDIIVAAPYEGFTLLDTELRERGAKPKHAALLSYNPVFTVAEGYVYYAKAGKQPKNNDPVYDFTKASGSDVYRVSVDAAGFGAEELVKKVPG